MQPEILVGGITFLLTFLTYVVYVTARFAKLETDVKHQRSEIDDLNEIKQIVYKIYAQNDLLLSLRNHERV